MSSAVAQENWIASRIMAHEMKRRGHDNVEIARRLQVCTRSVNRYLELPCPDPSPSRGVALEDFVLQGACASFPELNWQTRKIRERDECKAVCTYCPVLTQCRDYGLGAGLHDAGIWGAMTKCERQREAARIRRERSADARPGGAG